MQVREASPGYLAKAEAHDVPPGHKRTEAGVIPEDWGVRSLADEIDRLDSGVSVNSVDEELQVYALEQAILKTSAVSGGNFLPHESKRIAPKDIRRAKLNPRKDTIIVSRMNTPQLVGECGYVDRDYLDLYLPDRLWMTHLYAGSKTSVKWLSYLLSHAPFKSMLQSAATGTSGSMKNIAKYRFFSISIPFPAPVEQRAIAEALSDVDGLLGALEALIAKKRAIKQAAMQQLLVGKTRLPRFSGKWETKRLGDIGSFLKGGGVTREQAQSGPFACVRYGEIYTTHNNYIRAFSSWISAEVAATATHLEKGDLLFAGSGETKEEIGKCVAFLHDIVAYAGGDIVILRPRGVDSLFLGYALNTAEVNRQKASLGQGDAVVHISATALAQVSLRVPLIGEQTAIATVVSDMDAEIAALEARRDKTRAIKQGMMQQLLTGRIRLVDPEIAVYQDVPQSQPAKPHSPAFNEAVVISMLAKQFGSDEYPLGRKRYTKLSYLLHRYHEKAAEGYLKKAAGPYNPKTRYGGAEKIAINHGYIKEQTRGRFRGFIAGRDIGQAITYFEKWYGADAGHWLEQFRYKSNDELELLATVDMAAKELRDQGLVVAVGSVKEVIAGDQEWKAKLSREIFSDDRIAEAIEQCQALFGEHTQ